MRRNVERLATFGTTFAVMFGVAITAAAQAPTRSDQGPYGPGPGMMGGPAPGMMGGGGPGMMGGGGAGMMGGTWNTESYLDSLKTKLGITASQEPAWKDYADTVLAAGEQMQGLHQTMFKAMVTASWQERQSMMNQMFQTRQQVFNTVHQAADKLLPALDPKQKATAQVILPGLIYGNGMMGEP
jgi:hypothetical protein